MMEGPKPTFTSSVQRFALNSDPITPTTPPPIETHPTTHLTRTRTAQPRKRKSDVRSLTDYFCETNPPASASNPRKKPKRAAPPSSSSSPPGDGASTTTTTTTNNLTDSILPNLITLFIGLNPGLRTAAAGHSYAHPSNLFWRLLHRSRCTPCLCLPADDRRLPRAYGLGFTNLVTRPTRDGSSLSKAEMDAGVAVLEAKVREWRPESVCIVGKGIWEAVWRVRHRRAMGKGEFRYGWQGEGENMGVIEGGGGGGDEEGGWAGASVFVATTTSGLAAGMRLHEKEEVWRGLGEWVERRRREQGIPDEGRREHEGGDDGGNADDKNTP